MPHSKVKKVEWVDPSKDDLKAFPEEVRKEVGFALFAAQMGVPHAAIKTSKGFGGASVREIKSNDASGTYRVVFTVQFAKAIYVLHAFQKKSKSGSATPKPDMDLVKTRLKAAEELYVRKYGG